MLPSLGFWIKTAFLFLFRSGRSTAVLSLMLLTAVATLIFLSALAVGISDAMIRNSVSLYSGHISGFALPQALKRENLFVEGVTNVLKRLSRYGILSNEGRIETVVLIGIDPLEELKSAAIWKKTLKGKYLKGRERAVFLSRPLAEKLDVEPGEDLRFSSGPGAASTRFTVSGIYQTGIDQLDRSIAFCPLAVIPAGAETWSAAIFLEEGADPESVISIYHRALSEEYDFKSWAELMPDLKQLVDLNYISMGFVTVLVFGVVSLGIACAFVIFILKNLREYGIMKAMGATPGEMALLIVAEVILMNLAACFIGVLVGVLAVFVVGKTGIDLTAFTSHNRYFTVSAVIFPRLTFYSLGLPPALAFLGSLAAAIWPAVLVARRKAADVLRIV